MSDKSNDRSRIYRIGIVIFSTALSLACTAQDSAISKTRVTGRLDIYQQQVAEDSTKKMIDLKSVVPGIIYDLRYSGTNNFMQQRMYPEGTEETFLRLPAALALARVQEELNKKGLGLKIFDAYRPYSVTLKFWELVKDKRYVADPAKGSNHNRGTAVDLTIMSIRRDKAAEIAMGTGFDNFSDTAHHSFKKLPREVLQNRLLLKSTMEKYGFISYDNEWWHYTWRDNNRFELLDIDFKQFVNKN